MGPPSKISRGGFNDFPSVNDHIAQQTTVPRTGPGIIFRQKLFTQKTCWGDRKIISSSLPPFWLAFLLPAFLPRPSLLLPCGFHPLPERVIKFFNLSINKYFGRNAISGHRIPMNHHVLPSKMAVSGPGRFFREYFLKCAIL